jgi:hypothetical protein
VTRPAVALIASLVDGLIDLAAGEQGPAILYRAGFAKP